MENIDGLSCWQKRKELFSTPLHFVPIPSKLGSPKILADSAEGADGLRDARKSRIWIFPERQIPKKVKPLLPSRGRQLLPIPIARQMTTNGENGQIWHKTLAGSCRPFPHRLLALTGFTGLAQFGPLSAALCLLLNHSKYAHSSSLSLSLNSPFPHCLALSPAFCRK